MKKEDILVPKNKNPLNVLAEMGERTKNAWIFLHRNVVEKLSFAADSELVDYDYSLRLYWDEPKAELRIHHYTIKGYFTVLEIHNSNIAFTRQPTDPEEIIFLKMDE